MLTEAFPRRAGWQLASLSCVKTAHARMNELVTDAVGCTVTTTGKSGCASQGGLQPLPMVVLP